MHTRNDDVNPNALGFTDRYIQVLVNRGGRSFSDETRTGSCTAPPRGHRLPNREAPP